MDGRHCTQILTGGKRCGGFATTGSVYCFSHDPAKVPQREQARKAGGKAPRGRAAPTAATLEPVSVRSTADVLLLVEATINDLRAGRLDPRVSNAVGYLANVAVKVLEQTEVERRLEALESVLDEDRRQTVALRRRL